MAKFHIRADGTVGQCFAKNKPCPLGEERHFTNEAEANKVSQIIMEQKFGVVDEGNKVVEAETPRNKQKSYENVKMYDNDLYGFDDEKPMLKKAGIRVLKARRDELEETKVMLISSNLNNPDDMDKLKENQLFVDDLITASVERSKKQSMDRLFKKREREEQEAREQQEARERIRREEERDSRSSGCGGSSSGCGC